MNWSTAFELGRVSNLPTVWTNVLAGLVLSGGPVPAGPVIGLLVALTLFYVGGMYLNDAFDREIDALERPRRPIPSGRVAASTVFTAGFAMLGSAIGLLLAAGYLLPGGTGWPAAGAGLALAGAIVLYDRFHKGNPLGPLIMGVCRVLVYVTAALSVTLAPDGALYFGAAVLLCYLVGLTYAAKQENLNRVANLWPLAFLAVPVAGVPVVLGPGGAGLVLLAAFALWVLYALSWLVVPSRIDVPRAVVSLLAGICLLDASLIAAAEGGQLAWLAAAGFPLTLLLQRWVSGT